jgi:site-specific DNA recombinase
MASPAKHAPLRLVPSGEAGAGAGELVPVAFLGRTSTADMQDPRAALNRQLRAARAWLPAGWFLVAYYWDVESGGLDLEARGRGQAWRAFASAGLPRDGGLAHLLAEAATGNPRFAAVVCEDIERSGRDTFNALKLEKKLSRAGIALFATDEPAVTEGVNSTTVLVRRMKQSVAEWLRLQIKEKTWKGLAEHALDGWNIGPAPYGYAADRVPHPVPVKASQGRSKTRLAIDPQRAPVVAQIFTWRVLGKLGMPAIAARLNADPARYPAPGGRGWTTQTVYAILRNPKYTGHMVYGRIRKIGGQRVTVPRSEWLWSPEPVHPAIVDRATWDAAQPVGRDHATTRDGRGLSRHPAARRTYAYRGRVRCRDCRRRMAGVAYASTGAARVYYQCPHNPANPRHAAANPDHPRTVNAPETRLDAITGLFFRDRVFGPGRAALLATQLPATDAAAAADRDAQVTALTAKLRQNAAAQKAQILANETIPSDLAPAAAAAMRASIAGRFAELHDECHQLQARLDTLTAVTPKAADTRLLDELPLAGDILPGMPDGLKTRLLAAFDIQILWNKPGRQVTVHAEITDTTLRALPGILNPRHDGYDDTSENAAGEAESVEDLFEAPLDPRINHEARISHANLRPPHGRADNAPQSAHLHRESLTYRASPNLAWPAPNQTAPRGPS